MGDYNSNNKFLGYYQIIPTGYIGIANLLVPLRLRQNARVTRRVVSVMSDQNGVSDWLVFLAKWCNALGRGVFKGSSPARTREQETRHREPRTLNPKSFSRCHQFDFRRRQFVQRVHQLVNLPIRGLDLALKHGAGLGDLRRGELLV